MKILPVCLSALLLAAAPVAGPATAQELRNVNVGTLSSASDIGLFIADEKGWFAEEGIKLTTTTFDSAARMVAPLGAGQLDVGGGSPSAGLYNAIARGINIRLVADRASSAPGYGATKLVVRKDLYDSGKVTGFADLKGLTVAMNAPGVSNTAMMNAALGSVGLSYGDINTVDMPFPQHVVALENKSVDAAAVIEPNATLAVQRGLAVPIGFDDKIIPNHQIAVLIYSETFAQDKDLATAFMRAYLRGVRYYNDALKDGHIAGANADEVIAIMSKYTPFKDAAVIKAMTPTGIDPDGRINLASLKSDYDFYASQGLIEKPVEVEGVVDTSFAEAALAELGPYKPSN